jgi:hypothetical protein
MGTAAPASRLHRSWPQRFLITFNCTLIAMCVMAASALGYSYYRFGNIPRVSLGGFLADEPPGRPQNYLLVGSDSREFVQGADDLEAFGDTSDSAGVSHAISSCPSPGLARKTASTPPSPEARHV